VYLARSSARAASVSSTLLHQHPASEISHANGCPHASQVPGRLRTGPERLQVIVSPIVPDYRR